MTIKSKKALAINIVALIMLMLVSIYLSYSWGYKKGYRTGTKETIDMVQKMRLQTQSDMEAIDREAYRTDMERRLDDIDDRLRDAEVMRVMEGK